MAKNLPDIIVELGEYSDEKRLIRRSRCRYGVLEFLFQETIVDPDAPEAEEFLGLMPCRGASEDIMQILQKVLADHNLPRYEVEPLSCDDESALADHPGFEQFENPAHPVRMALDALGRFARARRFKLLAVTDPNQQDTLLRDAFDEVAGAAFLAGVLVEVTKLEKKALAGERVIEGGKKSADLSRQRRGTPTTEERLKAWREAWAGDTGAKWGRRKRVAKKLCRLFGTTEASEIKFFNRNRDHIVNG